ncbi:UDP-N-acetylglucosamine--N-acetylmuramyl-(pentapeptide) pyrophosphoryl-undecaprenol N-acetylglucosamine transferase [Stetteria hydrogenophila]
MAPGVTVGLTASGGGHTGYARAIGLELARLGAGLVFYTPRGDSWSRSRVEGLGRVVETPMPRLYWEPLWRTLHRWPGALLEALRKVPGSLSALVNCGNNHAVPLSFAAWLKGVPVVNVESSVRFTSPGRTQAVVRRIAAVTLVQWEEQLRIHPGAVVVGPLYEPPRYEPRDEGYVLVTAGTMGFKRLFDAVLEAGLERLGLGVVLQTGRVDPGPYRAARPGWRVFRFDPDFERWLAGASVVVTHFPGKTGMEAALAYRKPVVLVAHPELRLSASVRDGPIYAGKIGAVYLEDPTPRGVLEAVREALGREPPRIPSGAPRAAREVLSVARGG